MHEPIFHWFPRELEILRSATTIGKSTMKALKICTPLVRPKSSVGSSPSLAINQVYIFSTLHLSHHHTQTHNSTLILLLLLARWSKTAMRSVGACKRGLGGWGRLRASLLVERSRERDCPSQSLCPSVLLNYHLMISS